MTINTLKNLPNNLKGKKILLRVDFNVPLKENGDIQDDTRIKESLPTIENLLQRNCALIIVSHLGRPKNNQDPVLRMDKIGEHLAKILKRSIKKINDIVGAEAKKNAENLKPGEILLLENVRFNPGEENCDPIFTEKLAKLADIFVNDAFGTAHRKHSSTAGVAEYLPAYAGLLMEKEIKALSKVLSAKIPRPLTMIFGGAKIDTKIGIIENFIDQADYMLIGGGLANTFLYAEGKAIGASLYEPEKKELAKSIMQRFQLTLPSDLVIAKDISENAKAKIAKKTEIGKNQKILDIGPETIKNFSEIIKKSGTVIWNGPLGLYEYPPFSSGTKKIAEVIAESSCYSIIGGGDTIDALIRFHIKLDKFSHVSTGGGACLEFLEGKILPGIAVLQKII